MFSCVYNPETRNEESYFGYVRTSLLDLQGKQVLYVAPPCFYSNTEWTNQTLYRMCSRGGPFKFFALLEAFQTIYFLLTSTYSISPPVARPLGIFIVNPGSVALFL